MTEGSVTRHIQNLRRGSADAEEAIFDQYLDRLIFKAVAEMKAMQDTRAGALDAEIAAQSALRSVFERLRTGRENRSLNREQLLGLLLAKLRNKVIDQWREEHAQKRGKGAVHYAADWLVPATDESAQDLLSRARSNDPTPERVHQIKEFFVRAMEVLPDDICRQIARFELEGHTDFEISNLTGRALRTVKFKLRLIRATWQEELDRYAY